MSLENVSYSSVFILDFIEIFIGIKSYSFWIIFSVRTVIFSCIIFTNVKKLETCQWYVAILLLNYEISYSSNVKTGYFSENGISQNFRKLSLLKILCPSSCMITENFLYIEKYSFSFDYELYIIIYNMIKIFWSIFIKYIVFFLKPILINCWKSYRSTCY